MGINAIQVGSYKGNDDFTDMIKKINQNDISKIILIEPQEEFNIELQKVYEGFNFSIENVVITPNEDENEIIFYKSNKDKDKEISSIDREHLIKHNCTDFTEKKMKSTTLNKLLNKYDIIFLDILFIDAEGFDGKIIKSIDFDKFHIKKIFFENLHINNEDIISFLNTKNYSTTQRVLTNGWSNESIKKN